MRSGVHSVHEPTALAYRSGQTKGLLLAVNEGLEVVKDNRLGDGAEFLESESLEE